MLFFLKSYIIIKQNDKNSEKTELLPFKRSFILLLLWFYQCFYDALYRFILSGMKNFEF
jgi:hypothetical protein